MRTTDKPRNHRRSKNAARAFIVNRMFIEGKDISNIALSQDITENKVAIILFGEYPPEDIPMWRKDMIRKASKMLDSKISSEKIRDTLKLTRVMWNAIYVHCQNSKIKFHIGQKLMVVDGPSFGRVGTCEEIYPFTGSEILPYVRLKLGCDKDIA